MVKKLKKDAIQDIREYPETYAEGYGAGDDKMIIETLTQKLQDKEKEAAENYDKYVRAVAEMENYKKRAARDRADSLKFGQENLIKDILPLMDSLDRAMAHAGKSNDFEAFKEGLQLLQNQFSGCLGKQGVEQIEAAGRDFDPNVHEAVLQVESPDHGHNQVVQEFEKGYLLNGRLLRPSKVSVCLLPEKENAQ
ncbi:MAG: nucleotide exchange factor GrpE [Syntrophales bacterium]|nr:nucleotide exchange factor GrpE [Syntrophales bacterium]